MKISQIRRWWIRGVMILAVVAATIIGIHVTHHTALAKAAAGPGPSGCPTVPDSFHGILASVPTLALQAPAGFPANSMPLTSFQWGVGRGISSPTGGSGDRESSAPSVSEMTITRLSDENDPLLFNNAAQGGGLDWTLYIYRAGGSSGASTCENITLYNTLISKFSMSSDGDRPAESLSLNFTKITVHHFANDSSFTYDLATGQSSTP